MPRFRLSHSRGNFRGWKNPPPSKVSLFYYTACTLKLRPVKLLFVIFGRLSYSFFVNLMVWGSGRLSYLMLKNHPFFIKKWPIFDRFFARGGSNGLCSYFLLVRLTKDCIYNSRETHFRNNKRLKQWSWRNFMQCIASWSRVDSNRTMSLLHRRVN